VESKGSLNRRPSPRLAVAPDNVHTFFFKSRESFFIKLMRNKTNRAWLQPHNLSRRWVAKLLIMKFVLRISSVHRQQLTAVWRSPSLAQICLTDDHRRQMECRHVVYGYKRLGDSDSCSIIAIKPLPMRPEWPRSFQYPLGGRCWLRPKIKSRRIF